MSKFLFTDIIDDLKKTNKDDAVLMGLGSAIGNVSDNPEDYVVLPDWWKRSFGILGLQFGRIVQVAGDSDSGKTTMAMQAIKAAQDQGYGIVYVETEGKTPVQYFLNWDIDPDGVLLVQSKFVESAFDGGFAMIDKFFERYPKEKLLFVFDSYGNTVSKNDYDNSMGKESRVGGTAKVNRKAINILIAKQQKFPIAALIINYTYDNIGSHGKTNAGGKALNFFSTITIQTQRTGWIEGQVKGEKVRKGAKVKWSTFKNQYMPALKDVLLPKAIELSITDEGFKLV
jgi:recombination protein RecA